MKNKKLRKRQKNGGNKFFKNSFKNVKKQNPQNEETFKGNSPRPEKWKQS